MRQRPSVAGLLGVTLAVVLLAGCGTSAPSGRPAGSTSGPGAVRIPVVASTNVYGDIAQQVGGAAVQVTSIISDADQDPHSYQASTQVALQLSKARLVIENGGGYDDFVDTMLKAGRASPVVVNAVAVSGVRPPAGGELNEHVWYDLPSVKKIADRIATELGRTDPGRAATFTANATRFNARVDRLIATEVHLKRRYAGEGVSITEPVPLYLLDAIGLVNKTPPEFSEAAEQGEDVSAAVLKETLDLYATHEVKALVYNAQTSGPVTERVKLAADQAGIPVVPVTEILPQGQTYLSWMQGNIAAVSRALSQP